MIRFIKEEELASSEKPGDGWYMIEAQGEHGTVLDDGRRIIQVLDNEGMKELCRSWDKELLVDCDHLSRDPEKETVARGWLKEVGIFDEGGKYHLCGRIEWTPSGRKLIEGKEYKHFSTEYETETLKCLGGERYRPSRLVGLALTNRPNNKGQRPITNRESGATQEQEERTMEELKKIAVELDLPEEASVEDILGAIGALREATAEAQEAEAEAILNSEGGEDMPPEEKEMMKEELIKNRARALKVLKNRAAGKRGNQVIKTAAVYARPIMNRAGLNNKADKTRKALSI